MAYTPAVTVVRLDDEVREHVRFLKIDIQGGELRMLRGAERLMAVHGIDVIYIEFNGDIAVLQFLARQGYVIFDSVYDAWPSRRYWRNWFAPRDKWRLPGRETVGTGAMSTGATLHYVWPRVPLRSFAGYCAWFFVARQLLCWLQTNLICVHRSVLAAGGPLSSPPPGR